MDITKSHLIAAPPSACRRALVHTGVPDDEAADIHAGWDDFHLGPMKALLEGSGRPSGDERSFG